jgi:hypothetical protein
MGGAYSLHDEHEVRMKNVVEQTYVREETSRKSWTYMEEYYYDVSYGYSVRGVN